MGLNKYGKDKWEDISDWTPQMIREKIREIENEQRQITEEYIKSYSSLYDQIDYLKSKIVKGETNE